MSIFATKSIEQLKAEAADTGGHSLKRVLGPINLVTLGVGAIIGTGIFVLTGQAAAQYAGPGIVLSMVLAGFASALAGLCYAEFASTVPIAGSAYTYGYATLGEFIAWIIGWDLILEYALGAATVAVGWSGHLNSFLNDFVGVSIPPAFAAAPCTFIAMAGCSPEAIINLPAVFITLAVTVLIVIGIKESANVNAVDRDRQGRGRDHRDPGRRGVRQHRQLDAVHPAEHRQLRRVRVERRAARRRRDLLRLHRLRRRVGRGAGSEEPAEGHAGRHPRIARRLHDPLRARVGRHGRPRALQGDAGIGGADGGGDSRGGGGVGRQLPAALDDDAGRGRRDCRPELGDGRHDDGAAAHLLRDGQGRAAAAVREEDSPEVPHAAHHEHHHRRAGRAGGGFTPIGALGELVSIGTLLAFVIVSIGIVFLRYQRPELERPFRTPWVPFVPILSALVSLALMAGLPFDTWLRLIIWMVIGVVFYFAYGFSHSEVRKRDEKLHAGGGTRRR